MILAKHLPYEDFLILKYPHFSNRLSSRAWLSLFVLSSTASQRKTYAGTVHTATQVSAALAKTPPSSPERAPRRFVAIPNCRKFRNAHKYDCEPARRERKTSFRTLRSATARRLQIQKDDPAPSGASTAVSSIHDSSDRLEVRFRWAGSPASIGEKRNLPQEAVSLSTRYNNHEERTCPTTPQSTPAPASNPNCPRSKPGPINSPATLSPRASPNTPPSAPRPAYPTSAPSPFNTCPKKIASSSKPSKCISSPIAASASSTKTPSTKSSTTSSPPSAPNGASSAANSLPAAASPPPSSPAGPPSAPAPNASANLERSPYSGRRHRHKSLGRFWVPLDKSEGVVKTDFFSAMLCSTAWISERWRTEALKLSR